MHFTSAIVLGFLIQSPPLLHWTISLIPLSTRLLLFLFLFIIITSSNSLIYSASLLSCPCFLARSSLSFFIFSSFPAPVFPPSCRCQWRIIVNRPFQHSEPHKRLLNLLFYPRNIIRHLPQLPLSKFCNQ